MANETVIRNGLKSVKAEIESQPLEYVFTGNTSPQVLVRNNNTNLIEYTKTNISTLEIKSSFFDTSLYQDSYIEISLENNTPGDIIRAEVLVDPLSELVSFIWDAPGATNGSSNLNVASGSTALNTSFRNDAITNITVFAPGDTSYPYYEIKITKSNPTDYAGVPLVTRVDKWFI
jgi:hypothetical protein